MAGTVFVCAANNVATKSGGAHCVMGITTATDKPAKVLGWGIYFNGTSSTGEPINVKLQRYSAFPTFGTVMGNVTPPKVNTDLSANVETDFGYNPASINAGTVSTNTILDIADVHPQSGYDVRFPLGQEVWIPAASSLGIEVNNAGTDINCNIKVILEE